MKRIANLEKEPNRNENTVTKDKHLVDELTQHN
jgi:hypothetical protein